MSIPHGSAAMNRNLRLTLDASDTAELVRRAQAGDAGARAQLVARIRRRVLGYLSRMTGDDDQAADLTQDTLVAVLQTLDSLRDADRFWPWIYSIAANKARQHFRTERRRRALQPAVLARSPGASGVAPGPEGLDLLSRNELIRLTRLAIDNLAGRYRLVLVMRFYEARPHADIARTLACSELNARATCFRAKLALRQELRRLGIISPAPDGDARRRCAS